MQVLVIAFDRTRQGKTRREKRYWTFADSGDAELEPAAFPEGRSLRQALNPALANPDYWEGVLTKLEQGQPLDMRFGGRRRQQGCLRTNRLKSFSPEQVSPKQVSHPNMTKETSPAASAARVTAE